MTPAPRPEDQLLERQIRVLEVTARLQMARRAQSVLLVLLCAGFVVLVALVVFKLASGEVQAFLAGFDTLVMFSVRHMVKYLFPVPSGRPWYAWIFGLRRDDRESGAT